MVRGFDVYKDVWDAEEGEILICEQEISNRHDPYAVLIFVVEHTP